MVMRVKARVLLELGSELISSDQIALYELIKNSLDAGADRVDIKVMVLLERSKYLRLQEEVKTSPRMPAGELRDILEQYIEPTAPEEVRKALLEKVLSVQPAERAATLLAAYIGGSSIQVNDDGSGMGHSELETIYLTLGTPNRLLQKRHSQTRSGEALSNRGPLGEKGIGRLSAMRLGGDLRVLTTRSGDPKWYELHANWQILADDPDLDLEEFPVDVKAGARKPDPKTHGTRIRISDLQSDWRIDTLRALAQTDFAKLIDPFTRGIERPDIRFQFNGASVTIPTFESRQLTYAHARCEAHFSYDDKGSPVLAGEASYKSYSRSKSFRLTGVHLLSALARRPGTTKAPKKPPVVSPIVASGIDTLGPFAMEAYWFNRQRLRNEKPDGFDAALNWLKSWGGGLMLFRNNFRVYPYAELHDDWLDLDGAALGSGGYKLNRKQIVGAVRITSRDNPQLQDQTNREGLRDCKEKSALVVALRYILFTEFRVFLNSVEAEVQEGTAREFKKLEERVDEAQRVVIQKVKHLRTVVPAKETKTIDQLLDRVQDLVMAWERAKETIAQKDNEIESYLYLAGVGLMTEFIFHELTRLTRSTLNTLHDYKSPGGKENAAQLAILRSQLTTLDKRVRILDPMATPGRQRKERLDLRQLVDQVLDAHQEQFKRHQISLIWKGRLQDFEVYAVKGQLIQILENFISNSVYWLGQDRDVREFDAQITVVLDVARKELHFADNGPGIPTERATDVFQAFYTTKPPGLGRGLGLYIAKKLAEYNQIAIELEPAEGDRCHRGFVLRFGTEER